MCKSAGNTCGNLVATLDSDPVAKGSVCTSLHRNIGLHRIRRLGRKTYSCFLQKFVCFHSVTVAVSL
jgi:hypothetical protein